jgi:hypothetical protein
MLSPAVSLLGGLILIGILLIATATTCVRYIGRSSVGTIYSGYDEERAERTDEGIIEGWESTIDT